MQEKFGVMAASRAAAVFKKFLDNPEKKEEINSSNKTLIILTTLAYFGECSKTKMKRAIPVSSLDASLEELVKLGYITRHKDGKEVYYKYIVPYGFNPNKQQFNDNTLYLFANALMNMSTYIKQYNITAWNILALMLEAALKCTFEGKSVNLTESNIKSIAGAANNKLLVRKNLERMGVIKAANMKERAYGGDYLLNKKAYIIEIK